MTTKGRIKSHVRNSRRSAPKPDVMAACRAVSLDVEWTDCSSISNSSNSSSDSPTRRTTARPRYQQPRILVTDRWGNLRRLFFGTRSLSGVAPSCKLSLGVLGAILDDVPSPTLIPPRRDLPSLSVTFNPEGLFLGGEDFCFGGDTNSDITLCLGLDVIFVNLGREDITGGGDGESSDSISEGGSETGVSSSTTSTSASSSYCSSEGIRSRSSSSFSSSSLSCCP